MKMDDDGGGDDDDDGRCRRRPRRLPSVVCRRHRLRRPHRRHQLRSVVVSTRITS